MDNRGQLAELAKSLKKREGADPSLVLSTLQQLGVNPPADFVAFYEMSNGASGFMPNGEYLSIDPIETLLELNEPYGFGAEGPGLIAFASNGARLLFAFNLRSKMEIVAADAISMDCDELKHRGNSMTEFLRSFEQG